ncbi:hypothetical protein [Inhella sp.]|uniref:hypothetical protein n=1 Tax=Inhella sp. TaxID=1921806 RepID=UPI0035AEE0B8
MKFIRLVLVGAFLGASALSQASPQAEALGQCLAENTSGKDRKDLARWVYVAMSAHPEMKALATQTGNADEVSRVAGALFTRLLADNCPAQTRAAMQAGGPVAIQTAFTTLGQLAMQELMSNKDVAATLGQLERHLDRAKLEALAR